MMAFLIFLSCGLSCSFFMSINSLNRHRLTLPVLQAHQIQKKLTSAISLCVIHFLLLVSHQGLDFAILLSPLLFFVVFLSMSLLLSFQPAIVKAYLEKF